MTRYQIGLNAIEGASSLFDPVVLGRNIDTYGDSRVLRRLDQTSPFGAFLDPVADKLMVASALVLLVADPVVQGTF